MRDGALVGVDEGDDLRALGFDEHLVEVHPRVGGVDLADLGEAVAVEALLPGVVPISRTGDDGAVVADRQRGVFVDPNKDYKVVDYKQGVKLYYAPNPLNDTPWKSVARFMYRTFCRTANALLK